MRRSVVFIVDSQYDSVFFRDKAMQYTKEFFDNECDGEDYFGFIPLVSTKSLANGNEIILEKRSSNEHVKKRTLKEFSEREMDFVVHASSANQNKTIMLERALQKAFDWQNTLVPDYERTVNGKVYVGPLKWIVCLLGDDAYPVNQFLMNSK